MAGLRAHAAQGYNLGKVLDGYLPERIPHPAPSKASQGRTKTLLVLDEQRAPIIAAIYPMRAEDKLGVPAVHARLSADPGAYPPADPATGWTSAGSTRSWPTRNTPGTRCSGGPAGKAVPEGQWYWPDQRTHPAIVDREVWQAAQKVGAEHRSSRDGALHNPANWRSYPFRSRVRCKICKRRMCGLTKVHADNKTPTEYAYYVCQYNPHTPSHVAAAPDHPRTVQVREDVLMAETFRGLAAYALAPGREQRLAELIPHTATARQAQHDRQAATLGKRLKRLTARQDNLMRELDGSSTWPMKPARPTAAASAATTATLHKERKAIETQLSELAADPPRPPPRTWSACCPRSPPTWPACRQACKPNYSRSLTSRSSGTRRCGKPPSAPPSPTPRPAS